MTYTTAHKPCQTLNPLNKARDQTCNLIVLNQIRFHCATRERLQKIFLWPHGGISKFQGQGLTPSHSSDLRRILEPPCAGPGSNPALCSNPSRCSQILNPLCHSGNSKDNFSKNVGCHLEVARGCQTPYWGLCTRTSAQILEMQAQMLGEAPWNAQVPSVSKSQLRRHPPSPSLHPASAQPWGPGTPSPPPLTRTRPEANPESVMSVLAALASALPYRKRQMCARQWR